MEHVKEVIAALDKKEKELLDALSEVRSARETLAKLFGSTLTESSLRDVAVQTAHATSAAGKPVAWLDEVRGVLLANQRPMHIQEIMNDLEARGIEIRDRQRVRDIISGGVSRKARRKETFTHVGKGTFGLVFWRDAEEMQRELSDATTTAALMQIIRQEPGLTSGDIVDRLAAMLGEPASISQGKRNSRVTRIGQLFREGAIERVDSRHYPKHYRLTEHQPGIDVQPVQQ